VAAFPDRHPESPSLDHDADVLVRKADAGADFAITQFFFTREAYVAACATGSLPAAVTCRSSRGSCR
jgi:5,10-methylenetetrahydrofolate reductase